MKMKHCDLCDAAFAAVFCPSDDAFLCRSCDAKVHQANFLVARHVRRSFCSDCCDLTGHGVSGETCPSCSPESDGDDSTGYSSDCVSSTTSPAEKEHSGGRANRSRQCSGSMRLRRGGGSRRVEGILVEWCGKLGVGADVDVRMASEGLRVSTVLPFRVCLAASMWLGLRRSVATSRVLKRLEEISGVPAKVIIATSLKLERGLRGGSRRRLELEEGWAES